MSARQISWVLRSRASDFNPEPWGGDADLVAVFGERGATQFRALFDDFPEAVGVLWALPGDGGRIVDFGFGYGNPAMLRGFRLPAATRDRYTLLEALPRMRGSRAFDSYVRRCANRVRPWVTEVTYDTPFADGYMLGTFVLRAARLGDGLIVFMTDVTEQRRMESELSSYAQVVAHDLREPVTSIALLVTRARAARERAADPELLELLRASTKRAHELIDAVLLYARVGELQSERVDLGRLVARSPRISGRGSSGPGRRWPSASCQRSRVTRGSCAGCSEPGRKRAEVPRPGAAGSTLGAVRPRGMGGDRARQRGGRHPCGRAGSSRCSLAATGSRGHRNRAGGVSANRRGPRRKSVKPAEGGGSAFRFTLPATRLDRAP